MQDNMKLAGLNEKDIESIIKNNISKKSVQVKDMLILSVDKAGNGYLQTKKDEGMSFQTKRLVDK